MPRTRSLNLEPVANRSVRELQLSLQSMEVAETEELYASSTIDNRRNHWKSFCTYIGSLEEKDLTIEVINDRKKKVKKVLSLGDKGLWPTEILANFGKELINAETKGWAQFVSTVWTRLVDKQLPDPMWGQARKDSIMRRLHAYGHLLKEEQNKAAPVKQSDLIKLNMFQAPIAKIWLLTGLRFESFVGLKGVHPMRTDEGWSIRVPHLKSVPGYASDGAKIEISHRDHQYFPVHLKDMTEGSLKAIAAKLNTTTHGFRRAVALGTRFFLKEKRITIIDAPKYADLRKEINRFFFWEEDSKMFSHYTKDYPEFESIKHEFKIPAFLQIRLERIIRAI